MNRRSVVIVTIAVLSLVSVACGGSSGDHAAHMSEGDGGGIIPGSAADSADAGEEIVIEASDELRFDPDSIEVEAGEAVTFVIRNVGESDHEFVLGDEAYQQAHGDEMADGDHTGMDNAVDVAPGEEAELTWRFDEPGEVLYGCHEPGHYDGGMVGRIEVL